MKSLINFLEEKFVPVAAKIGAQRHLVAIRDGFVALMALLILGSMAVLINNLPIDAYQEFMTNVFGDTWKSFGGNLWMGSFAIMSLLVVFSISNSLAKSYDADPLAAGIVSFAALMTITQSAEEAWAIPYQWTGALGLFVSIIVALLATEIFVRLMRNKRLVFKMPDGVPPAVAKSFAALLPAIITLSIFSVLKMITVALDVSNIHAYVYELIQGPLSSVANTLPSAIFIAFTNHILWFFGLHGSNILEPIMQTVYLPALDANAAALAAGQTLPNIVTKPFFDAFVYMGGSGTTIALIIGIFIASKRKHHRSLAKMSLAPGLFNINEPMMFGMPIVLNPIFIIPFILTPVILTIFSYLMTLANIVPKTVALIPWTTPPIIGGWLATGGHPMGAILPFVNIIIAVIIYVPFIIMLERVEDKSEKETI